MKAPALAILLALSPVAALADPADLLDAVRSGGTSALEQAIVADLNRRTGFERPVGDFAFGFDEAVCHEAQRVWEPEDYVIGVCFIPVRGWQTAAQYALIVAMGEPVSITMLDFAVE